MSDSVGGVENSQLFGASALAKTDSTSTAATVDSGYSSQNSASIATSIAETKNSGAIPPLPEGTPLGSADFLVNGIKSRLQAFRSNIVISSSLASVGIDLSDTKSLLMILRGFLDELRIADKVNGVNIKAGNRDVLNLLTEDVFKLKSDVLKIDEQIRQKEVAIQSAEVSNVPATELRNELAVLQADKTSLEMRVTAKELLLAVIKGENNLKPSLADMLHKSAGRQSKVSGEEQLAELKHHLQVLAHLYEKEETKIRLSTDYQRGLAKEWVKTTDQSSIIGSSTPLQALIGAPSMSKLFAQLTGMATPPSPSREDVPTNQAMADTTAALGLILMATPPRNRNKAEPKKSLQQPLMTPYQEEAGMVAQTLMRRGRLADVMPPLHAYKRPKPPLLNNPSQPSADDVEPIKPMETTESKKALEVAVKNEANQSQRSANGVEPIKPTKTIESKEALEAPVKNDVVVNAQPENTWQASQAPLSSAVSEREKRLQPSPSAGLESPYDQPHLGDNLSFEGANNPQAYNLLLLEHYSEKVAEALQEEKQNSLTPWLTQTLNSQLFDLMIRQEQRVEKMVHESLKDQEAIGLAIQQSQKI